jgi:hypothetical protein
MRKLTLLPLVLVACGAGEDRCDPFLEAADCARGQTPVAAHRYGFSGDEAAVVRPPSQVGPTAGSANGPGPSPGSANGPGPTAGDAAGAGPTAGSSNGPGPTAGSANPADGLMPTDGSGASCATFCESFYGGACASQVDDIKIPAGALIEGCKQSCECLRRAIPECLDWLADVFSDCADRGNCGLASECLDSIEGSVTPPASCATIVSAIEGCGGEFLEL